MTGCRLQSASGAGRQSVSHTRVLLADDGDSDFRIVSLESITRQRAPSSGQRRNYKSQCLLAPDESNSVSRKGVSGVSGSTRLCYARVKITRVQSFCIRIIVFHLENIFAKEEEGKVSVAWNMSTNLAFLEIKYYLD